MGVGEGVGDAKKVNAAAADLGLIAGQKAVITRARKSIAAFKLREGMPIGAKVTLRQNRMYEFVDRLVNIALPRVRDFRGLNPKSFDGRGNYYAGTERAHHFPRDQFRRGRRDLGHGHHRLHHGEHRRRGARVAEAIEFSVPQLGFGGSGCDRRTEMAKTSMVERNKKRRRLAQKFKTRRTRLKAVAADRNLPAEERFAARLKLAELPRNSSPTRIRNRCDLTGRPRGYYRKLRMSRIALRDLASQGQIPGMVKSSW